jgi:hypothetical protein
MAWENGPWSSSIVAQNFQQAIEKSTDVAAAQILGNKYSIDEVARQ